MAVKPQPLMDHLRSHSDVFHYDELIGVTILTSDVPKELRPTLKAKFFDVFGLKEIDLFTARDIMKCDTLFTKIRTRIKSDKKRKFCFVYFVLGQNVAQDETGTFGARVNTAASFLDLESGIRSLASDYPQNSCHHAVFEFSGRRLSARPMPADAALIKNLMLLPMFENLDVFL